MVRFNSSISFVESLNSFVIIIITIQQFRILHVPLGKHGVAILLDNCHPMWSPFPTIDWIRWLHLSLSCRRRDTDAGHSVFHLSLRRHLVRPCSTFVFVAN